MQKHPIARSYGNTREVLIRVETSANQGDYLGGGLDHSLSDLCFAANTNRMILANPLEEIILVHRFCMVVDLPTVGFESFNSVLADVF